jgi:hypothetical protein
LAGGRGGLREVAKWVGMFCGGFTIQCALQAGRVGETDRGS